MLSEPEPVALEIDDMKGRLVRTLPTRLGVTGLNIAAWDGRDRAGQRVASGSYVYTVRTADGSASGLLQLIR
jgi:flagellar hook assembly protein FlgD